jgi:hypothetical protein
MASIHELIRGLELLAKYGDKKGAQQINGADHDIIYGGGTPLEWTAEDRAEMERLGWHVHNTTGDFVDGVSVLDEDAIWARFV